MHNTPYVYAITDGTHIKIGVAQRPSKRLRALSTGNAAKLTLLGYFHGGYEVEKQLHQTFTKVRQNGEWMVASPELISYLNSQLIDKFIVISSNTIHAYDKMRTI